MINQTIELRALIASLGRGDSPIVLGFAADGTPVANNTLSGLAPRVSLLEGLAGIPGGANLSAKVDALTLRVGNAETAVAGLANDNITLRANRYVARPGEDIRGWTASVTAAPKAAVPLAIGGIYNVFSDGPVRGPALRITGAGYATSIAKTHLDEGEIVEFTFRLARRIDNTGANAAANNVPLLELRCYKADLTDNGTIGLPATALLVADLLRTVTYRACLTPGVGTVDLPAGTCFISPLFGERGNGAIELASCDRSTQSFGSAPLVRTIAESATVLLLGADGSTIQRITGASLTAQIQEVAMPRSYTCPIAVSLGTVPQTVLGFDDSRVALSFSNPGTTGTIVVNVLGGDPVLGAPGAEPIPPMSSIEWDYGTAPPTAMTARADTPGVLMNVSVTNLSGIAPDIDAFLALFPARVGTAERLRIGILRGALLACGFLPEMEELHVYVSSLFGNAVINWANPGGAKATRQGTTLPAFGANVGLQGNEAGYVDTGIQLPGAKYTQDSNAMFALTQAPTIAGGSRFICGFGGGAIVANRSATEYVIRSSDNSNTIVTAGSPSRWTGFSRLNANDVIGFRDEVASPQTVPSTFQFSRNQLGLACNGLSGASGFSAATLQVQAAGRGVSSEVAEAARQAFLKFTASAGAV